MCETKIFRRDFIWWEEYEEPSFGENANRTISFVFIKKVYQKSFSLFGKLSLRCGGDLLIDVWQRKCRQTKTSKFKIYFFKFRLWKFFWAEISLRFIVFVFFWFSNVCKHMIFQKVFKDGIINLKFFFTSFANTIFFNILKIC